MPYFCSDLDVGHAAAAVVWIWEIIEHCQNGCFRYLSIVTCTDSIIQEFFISCLCWSDLDNALVFAVAINGG